MERFKKMLHRLLFPGKAVVIVSIPVAATLLFYVFAVAGDTAPVAYVSYVFSAWSLTVVCASIVPAIWKSRDAVHQNKYLHRYLTDIPFQTVVSLYGSLGVNLLYAALKFVAGVYYGSVWLITLAVYYVFLAILRFLLLRQVNRNNIGQNLISEWKRYRLCGVFLMLMNVALSGMVILVIHQNQGFEYAGYMIYVMAVYAFYTTVMAVVNIVKYRKLGSPVLSAAKAINLAAALVSMLALETAMLTQFSTNGTAFRQTMTGATGAVVCAFVLAMAVFMLLQSTRRLRRLSMNDSKP